MLKKLFITGLFTLACTTMSYSQINFHNIFSRSVRQGYQVNTHIDSLLLTTNVSSGSAKSLLTIVAEPQGYYTKKYTSSKELDTSYTMKVDSVEITLSFTLPTDFVVDSMWLWVDGTPVEAAIQDRALASSQYQQIVGRRRDPALLQYNGNGNYNLRIFPAESYKARKVAIQFHHTFDDNVPGKISTPIPIAFDSTYKRYYVNIENEQQNIHYVNAVFSTTDPLTYTIDLPGVGSGTFSNTLALNLSSRNITNLQQGLIIADDPSGASKLLWISKDKINNTTIAGLTATIADTNVVFENEPETRIIALDIKNKIWNWNDYYLKQAEYLGNQYTNNSYYQDYDILARAQKYAILCLEHYLDDAKKFNIVIGNESVQTLFEKPVPVHSEYIKKAVTAILTMTPNGSSSTEDVVRAACSQAQEGIVILISDLFEPYNYYDAVIYKTSPAPGSAGTAYNNTISTIKKIVDSTEVVLFTIDDNYRLSEISYASGGFRLGSLLNRFNIDYQYSVIDGKRVTIPIMPPLFGSRNSSGIRKLVISSDDLSDIVYTKDGYTYNYWYSNIQPEMPVLDGMASRTSMIMDPYYRPYSPTSTLLRIAGVFRTPQPKEITINIQGRLGGLKFNQKITAGTSLLNAHSSGEVQWAFRKSEALAQENYTDNALAIKAIGKQYHIITRQTSLLALEPGMLLWEDTLAAQSTNAPTTVRGEASIVTDMLWSKSSGAPTTSIGNGTGIDFDGISIDDLLKQKGISAVNKDAAISRPVALSVKVAGGTIRLMIPQTKGTISLKLFDLKGSLVLQKKLNGIELTGHTYNWNIAREARSISKGYYMLHIKTDIQTKVFRIPLIGK